MLGITDLQLSLTTLEEVFLNIAKSAEEEAEHLKELEDEKKKNKKKGKKDEESLTKYDRSLITIYLPELFQRDTQVLESNFPH